MKEQFEKVKTHVKNNKKVYIAAGVGVAVGAGVVLCLGDRVNVTQIAIGKNNVLKQTTLLVRRGHPGFVIKCKETGEVFASQNRAAEALGVSARSIARHLKGEHPNAGGFTFENLGEAA